MIIYIIYLEHRMLLINENYVIYFCHDLVQYLILNMGKLRPTEGRQLG